MEPSRRTLLGAVGAAGTAALAGCVGGVVPGLGTGDGSDSPPDHLGWLARPGRLGPATAARVAVLRPAAVPDAARRLRPFLPAVAPGVDPLAADRLVVGNGATVLTGSFDRTAVVAAARDAGYTYRRGVDRFWVLDDDDPETPAVGAGDDALVLAWPTGTASASTVLDTLLYGRLDASEEPATRWTADSRAVRELTTAFGTAPALVLDLGPAPARTAPARGRFAGAVARGVATDPAGPTRRYGLWFEGTEPVALDAVRTWAGAALTALADPTIERAGRLVTVTGEATDGGRIRTRLPAADRTWSGRDGTPGGTAALPDGAPPAHPVGERWRFDPGPDTAVAPPAVDDGRVYAAAADCYALDARDGAVLWRAGLAETAGPPVLAGDVVVVAGSLDGERVVVGLDRRSGRRRWTRRPDVPVATLAGGRDRDSGRDRVHVGLGVEYVLNAGLGGPADTGGAGTGGVLTFDAATGERVWRWTGFGAERLAVAADGTVLVGAVAPTSRVVALEPTDGTERWATEVGVDVRTLAAAGPGAVVTTPDAVLGLDADGVERWRHAAATGFELVGAAAADDAVYAAARRPDGAVGQDQAGGAVTGLTTAGATRWRTETPRRVVARPAVAGDRVHVVGAGGALLALDPSGRRRWTLFASGRAGTPVPVGETVYLPVDAGGLVALGPDWLPGPRSQLVRGRRAGDAG